MKAIQNKAKITTDFLYDDSSGRHIVNITASIADNSVYMTFHVDQKSEFELHRLNEVIEAIRKYVNTGNISEPKQLYKTFKSSHE